VIFGKLFPGGVHPKSHKALTVDKPIEQLPTPALVVIPFQEHGGGLSMACVRAGDLVRAGQPISITQDSTSVPCHASLAGKVKGLFSAPHPSGRMVPSIVIENEDADAVAAQSGGRQDYTRFTKQELIEIIRNAGVVDMGGGPAGAVHPRLLLSLEKKIDTLVINGLECEPYLTSDHRLLAERQDEIVEGIDIIIRIVEPAVTIIALSADRPQTVKQLADLVKGQERIKVKSYKPKYPLDAEKPLVRAVTRRRVLYGGDRKSVV
jgi:Na+-translocating ferredoxin:NAD+ oxidoreductase subunit C